MRRKLVISDEFRHSLMSENDGVFLRVSLVNQRFHEAHQFWLEQSSRISREMYPFPRHGPEKVCVCACHRPLAMILSVSGFDDPCKAHPSRPYHIAWVPGKSSLCLNVKNTCHPGNQNPSELDDARIALLVGWLGSWEKKIKPKPVKDANPF